jgi:hypothetical protein
MLTRTLAAGLALGALALLGSPARADEDAAARKARAEEGKKREEAERAALGLKVNAAIDRGITWLKGQQKGDGSYPGFADHLLPRQYNAMDVGLNALVMLTLAHGGVTAEDDAVKKCMRFCQFHYAGGNGSWNLKGNGKVTVYTAATVILALDALYRGVTPAVAAKRDRYGAVEPPKPSKCKYPDWVKKWIVELTDMIVKWQVATGGWRYPGNDIGSEEGDTDLSNTQYALLALDAAARCGIAVPAKTWSQAAEHVLKEQEAEGLPAPVLLEDDTWAAGDPEEKRFREVGKAQLRGWTYLPGNPTLPTGSMTCAGVTCLALAKERLWALEALTPDLRKRIDRGMIDGLAWLADHFTVDDNPEPPSQWHYYYLYGLERTGAKLGLTWVGRHDWYREGATYLLGAQEKDGGWKEAAASGKPADSTESAITQTCFAILFLKRSTTVPAVPLTPPVLTGDGSAPADGR